MLFLMHSLRLLTVTLVPLTEYVWYEESCTYFDGVFIRIPAIICGNSVRPLESPFLWQRMLFILQGLLYYGEQKCIHQQFFRNSTV